MKDKAIPQVAMRIGDIPPDNEQNVWGDYFKLIVVNARFAHPNTSETTTTATSYILLGAKNGQAFMKPITKEEADTQMANAFWSNASPCNVTVNPPQSIEPPLNAVFG